MSVNKLLTLIDHNHDRRTSRKTHHWINKLSEYDYLSYINVHKEEFHKGEFCIFRIFILCSKLSTWLNRYIKIVASITNFILSSLI